jgi:hypothetical protein
MKIVQVIPKADARASLKSLLKSKERELRGKSTFIRQREGRWVHVKHPGWINWDEAQGGLLVAAIQTKVPESEWQLLQSFIGYLDRHFGEHIESIAISYR